MNYKHDSFDCLCDNGFIGERCEKGRPAIVYNFVKLGLFALSYF